MRDYDSEIREVARDRQNAQDFYNILSAQNISNDSIKRAIQAENYALAEMRLYKAESKLEALIREAAQEGTL